MDPAVAPPPPSLIAPVSWLVGAPGLAASCSPRAGSSFAWSVDNGSVDSGQGSSSVLITPASAGSLRVAVVETDASGCIRPEASRDLQVVSFAGGTLFYPLPPCRVADTRTAGLPLGIGSSWGLVLAPPGTCEIPMGVRALAANVTVTGATGAGTLRVAAGSRPPVPDLDLVSFRPGQTRAVNTLIALPDTLGGEVTLYAVGEAGSVDVIVDVSGYFR